MGKFQKLVTNRFKFKMFLITKLPMAWIAGLRVQEVTDTKASVSVPYKWLSQNPFRSTYFAALSMAAEMSTGILVLSQTNDRPVAISTLVRKIEGDFTKKAVNITTFTCFDGQRIKELVDRAVDTGEAQEIELETIGLSEQGEEVARYKLTWGIKQKSS